MLAARGRRHRTTTNPPVRYASSSRFYRSGGKSVRTFMYRGPSRRTHGAQHRSNFQVVPQQRSESDPAANLRSVSSDRSTTIRQRLLQQHQDEVTKDPRFRQSSCRRPGELYLKQYYAGKLTGGFSTTTQTAVVTLTCSVLGLPGLGRDCGDLSTTGLPTSTRWPIRQSRSVAQPDVW